MKLYALAENCFAHLRLVCFLIAVFYFLPASANNCDSSHFQCTEDDSCVFSEFKCDGRNDCPNGSDEKDCPARPCLEEEFDCGNSTQCIPYYWACNGKQDCENNHDEDTAVCANLECPANMFFKCGPNSRCVPASWKCDQHNDCPVPLGETASSDEKNCVDQECDEELQFKCVSGGTCIDKTWRCDGQMDCPDNSDETGCPKTTCQENEFVCVTDGKCIPDRWTCDGDKDCKDDSDEWLNSTCKDKKPDASMCRLTSEFFCAADNQCIPQRWKCDGQQDCTDGSDEHDSICDGNKCRTDQFQCKKMHYCISATLQCDGVEQCLDGSDEEDCPSSNNTSVEACTERQFECSPGTCLPLEKLCDQHTDCMNNADEGTTQLMDKAADCKAARPCDTNNGGCQQLCLNTFNTDPHRRGFKCFCQPGFKVDPSSPSRCLDVNECDGWGVCSQQCLNTNGSYKCRCLHGYALKEEAGKATTCTALTGEAHLLVSHRHDIRTVGTRNSHNQEAVVGELRDAVAIDYSAQQKLIFWSDLIEEKIYSANEETGVKKELAIDTKVVDGIAFDWIHKLLYFTEAIDNLISALTIGDDVTKRCHIITSNLDEPRAIVLDPKDGLLFWTDWGAESKIERADLDGSNRKLLVDSTEVVWPNGLTIDTVLSRLYWVDGKSGKIGSMRYDGADKKVILSSLMTLPHPFSIAVFEDLLYISDWDRQAIFSLNKFTGIEDTMIYENASRVMALRVRHDLLQPTSDNYCAGHGCQYMCLPRALAVHTPHYKYRCACPPKQFLGRDGVSCSATAPTTSPTTSVTTSATTSTTASARFSTSHKTTAKSGATAKAASTKAPEAASTKQHANEPTPSSSGTKPGKLTPPTVSSSTSPAHHVQAEAVSRSSGKVAGIVIGALCALAVIAALVGFLVYRGYVKRNAKTIGFDNPVYRKTTAAEDTISLDHAFQPKSHRHSSSVKLPLTEDTDDTA